MDMTLLKADKLRRDEDSAVDRRHLRSFLGAFKIGRRNVPEIWQSRREGSR